MSKQADTYTVTQASLALSVSTKRVRQMINEGKLKAHSTNPVTIKQGDVIDLKIERERAGAPTRTQRQAEGVKSNQIELNNDLVIRISDLITQQHSRALELVTESNQRRELDLIAQINELKAENNQLRARKWWHN